MTLYDAIFAQLYDSDRPMSVTELGDTLAVREELIDGIDLDQFWLSEDGLYTLTSTARFGASDG